MDPSDLLLFDPEGVRRLRAATLAAGYDLAADQADLSPRMDEAGALIGVDQSHNLTGLSRIRVALDEMATDLTRRVGQVESMLADAALIDSLAADLGSWNRVGNDPRLARLTAELHDLILELVGGHQQTALVVAALVATGMPVLDAVGEVARRADSEIAALVDTGLGRTAALTVASIATALDIDIAAAIALSDETGDGLLEVLGQMAIARNLGLTLEEAISIEDLRAHFEAFDVATGGPADGKVALQDLEYVVANPARFAPAQVSAAAAVLSTPSLWDRLDTAAQNGDVLAGSGFRSAGPGDGVTSIDDLQAFVIKAQLNRALGAYADQIDVAADPGEAADGFISRADLLAFADDDDLPFEVRAAALQMVDAKLFDQTWLEDHRDELALGAAVVAGATAGAVAIVATGGMATPLVVMGAGAASGAAASTGATLAVNASGDAHDTGDDLISNAAAGGMLGSTAAGLPIGFGAVGSASTLPARAAAAGGVLADVAAITWAGGVDIVIPESMEDEVHDLAEAVANLTGPAAEYKG